MGMLGKSICIVIASIIGYFIFRVVYGTVSLIQIEGVSLPEYYGWADMANYMLAAVPVVILAVGVASMLIRPSLFKEEEYKMKKRAKGR